MNTTKRQSGLEPTEKEIAIRTTLENAVVGRELFNFMCGDLLGYGISRMVFVYRPAPTWVIKIERADNHANVLEFNNWLAVEHSPHAKWFAPCKELSRHGSILLQKRAKRPASYDLYPKRVPIYMTDLKYQNWGMLNGNMVCLDYAGVLLNQYGLSKEMRVAKWWVAPNG